MPPSAAAASAASPPPCFTASPASPPILHRSTPSSSAAAGGELCASNRWRRTRPPFMACPYMSEDDYFGFLQTMQDFCSGRTMTPRDIYKNVPISSSGTFVDNYVPTDLKVPFLNKAFLRVKAYDNHNLDGIHMKEALHRRCIEKLYDDDPERDDLLIYISSLCRRYKVSPHVEGCFQ
ncbi:hypothetical protein TRIUR3_34453 [Triticum urartu]|uniref:Uncharacterized protein n=1 Tax=Triticum urartu TaxID=4572 RepID=M7YWI5_TRIUA|nr:hypothetical protein TRIUR3_34453 [Triticum urartu]